MTTIQTLKAVASTRAAAARKRIQNGVWSRRSRRRWKAYTTSPCSPTSTCPWYVSSSFLRPALRLRLREPGGGHDVADGGPSSEAAERPPKRFGERGVESGCRGSGRHRVTSGVWGRWVAGPAPALLVNGITYSNLSRVPLQANAARGFRVGGRDPDKRTTAPTRRKARPDARKRMAPRPPELPA